MTNTNALKKALEFLKLEKPFIIDGLSIDSKSNILEVTGWSQFQHLENITITIATQELQSVKEQFEALVQESSELVEFMQNKAIEYYLHFDDYGKASVEIGREINNVKIFASFIK